MVLVPIPKFPQVLEWPLFLLQRLHVREPHYPVLLVLIT